MTVLLKNGMVINVFTGEIEKVNVLIQDKIIVGVGDYSDADIVCDITDKFVCPGFIDGHIHIESTMLTPGEFTNVCVPCGTTSVVADPHEIANVCGVSGILYMLDSSENLPLDVYIMLPSCVPATLFDESGGNIGVEELKTLINHPRVLGLGEMMNYHGVISGDEDLLAKIKLAREHGKKINGHAPQLTGKKLDQYIKEGIYDEHECTTLFEAQERIRKGQWVMIREGTSAQNLKNLIGLFDGKFSHRCLLVCDDKHPADLIQNGHVDNIIRKAVTLGRSAIVGVQMATIQAAEYFGLKNKGAIAPGYDADILLLDDLDRVEVSCVYKLGKKVAENGKMLNLVKSKARDNNVLSTIRVKKLVPDDFNIKNNGKCRVIKIIPGEILTRQVIRDSGVDVSRDILKLAVVERHKNTGNVGLGYIEGIGLKKGAVAASVSHDSHNLIIIGTNDDDMACAGNCVREMGGGCVVTLDGKIIEKMSLPIAGLMSDKDALFVANQNAKLRQAVYEMGANPDVEPFMNMAFISLAVIPSLKMTTKGLVDVDAQKIVDLFV